MASTPTPTESVPPAPVPVPPTPKKSSLVWVLLFTVLLLSVVTGFFVWQNMQLRQQLAVLSSSTPPPSPAGTLVKEDDPTADWTTHKSDVLGIEFKLPPKLGLLEKSGKEVAGEKGTQFCMIYEGQLSFSIVGTVYAGGGPCGGGVFNIGTVSKDYEEGRMGGFGDLTGYVFQNSNYYVRFLNNVSTSPLSQDLVVEKTNPNNIKYLRIVGKNELQDWGGEKIDSPVAGTPGKGYLGVLINVEDGDKYAGFGISMEVKTEEDEKIFDQILSTFRFTE